MASSPGDPGEPPDLAEAVGGPLGIAETSGPAVVFVAAYAVSGSDTDTAAVVAVGAAVLLALVRLGRRESPHRALAGLAGVGLAAFIAARSGKAENFFLPGLLANGLYATACIVSIAVRRPLVGLVVGRLDGDARRAEDDPTRGRAFARATWMWAALFATRLTVQLPLYLAGAAVWLGVARTAMGLPLFALGTWLTWLLVRRSPAPDAAAR